MTLGSAARRSMTVIAALALTSGCLIGDQDGPSGGADRTPGRQQLTDAEAVAALPDAESLPEQLYITEETLQDERDDEATAYPATCLDARLTGPEGTSLDEHETAQEARAYMGTKGGSYNVYVSSHDILVPDKFFDDAGAAQGSCGEFQLIDETGTTKWELVPSTFALMGERTYAMRVKMLQGDEEFVGGRVQIAAVSLGHNLVYIVHAAGPRSNFDPALAERLAEIAVQNLETL